jgi:hypothetical protein
MEVVAAAPGAAAATLRLYAMAPPYVLTVLSRPEGEPWKSVSAEYAQSLTAAR